MRVLFADSNHAILHETLLNAGFECDLLWDKTAKELIDVLPVYDALVIRSKFRIDKKIIDNCPQLKCIGRVGAGMENIDSEYALSKSVVCLNVPEGNRDAVGEHAIGMLLMLLNKLKKADNEVRQGIWMRAENRGIEIKGKTVGIIGYGNTGSVFAKKLAGFDCKLLAVDKYKKNFGNELVSESDLQRLFNECDIISLHVPLTEETNYMADADFFNKFKKPIYFINTSRGKCVKTADLVQAIESKKVLGACLDVLEYEDLSFEAAIPKQKNLDFEFLLQSDNVVLSPHIAGWTHESNYKMSLFLAQKMIKVLKG